MSGFLILAALMLAAALAFVLAPLLRRGDVPAGQDRRLKALDEALAAGVLSAREYAEKRAALGSAASAAGGPAMRTRGTFIALLAVALLLPAGTLLLYRLIGEPRALDPVAVAAQQAAADNRPDMQQAIAGLAAKLKAEPNDAEGWALLGRAYKSTERHEEARDAFLHAHELLPDDPDVTVEYAEAMARATPNHRIDGVARRLIETTLAAHPDNQRGLWLLGISDYQAGQYEAAIASWNRLLPQLPPDSDGARMIAQQIAEARHLAGGADAATSATAAAPGPAVAGAADAAPAARLTVHVQLADALRARLGADDVLFVFAKAASGPPMPLAIRRLAASQLPITVTLDDSSAMMPNLKLSLFPQVIVGARISKSGEALAHSGDFQALSAPLESSQKAPVELTIDQMVP